MFANRACKVLTIALMNVVGLLLVVMRSYCPGFGVDRRCFEVVLDQPMGSLKSDVAVENCMNRLTLEICRYLTA
jgi:hypothetical protein